LRLILKRSIQITPEEIHSNYSLVGDLSTMLDARPTATGRRVVEAPTIDS